MYSTVHPIDTTIFAIFLITTLVVGLSYGRKVTTIRDYALGGKNFSTPTLTATIVATWISGSFLTFKLSKIYSEGLAFAIPFVCDAFTLLVMGSLLAVRMGKFLKSVSVAEAMGELYGKRVRIITALCGILVTLGGVAIQFQVSAKVLNILFDVEGPRTTIIAASIVILYSAFGGIRAVTFTDVLQFFTFGTLMPILALVIWNSIKNPDTVIHTLKISTKFHFKELINSPEKIASWSTLALFYFIPALVPPIFQRISMAKDVQQVKQSYIYSFGLCLLIALFTTWIAILIRADQPNLAPDKIFNHIIHRYGYVGLTGLLLSGMMAMIMSTADSHLNAAAVLFANDIAKPLNVSFKSPLTTAKSSSLVLGLLALFLALYAEDFLELVLLAWSFYMPIITVPLLLSIFGFRSSTRAVLVGMGLGFITVLPWHIFSTINRIIPGMAANLLGLLGSHYLLREPGGWQPVAPTSPLALARAARKRAWKRRIKAIKNFKLYPYLQQNLPQQEYFYFLFGLYTIAATYTGFYTLGDMAVKAYQGIYQGIYHTVLFATTALLTFPIWPPTVKSYRWMTFFWPVGICGILFFSGMLLVIMSGFHTLQVMVLMLNLLVAVLLLRWPLAVIVAMMGSGLAMVFFKQYTHTSLLPSGGLDSLQLKMMYGTLLFTSFLIALFKGKHSYRKLASAYVQLKEEKEAMNESWVAAIHHRENLAQAISMDKVEALATLKQMHQQLADNLSQAKSKEQLARVNQDVQVISDKLQLLTEHLMQGIYQTQDYMRLQVSKIALPTLMEEVCEVLDMQDPTFGKQVFTQQHSTCQALQADISKIKQLLVDSLYYAQQHQQAALPIQLALQDTTLGYPITAIQGHVKEVVALRLTITTAKTLPALRPLYMGSVERAIIRLPQSIAELAITHNQQIVDAHYGTSELIQNAQGMTQIYVIPVRVREVRPTTMDALYQVPAASDTTVYPAEKAFIKDIEKKTHIDTSTLQKTLSLIKQCHAGVKRKSGEPFYLHPIAVAHILLDYTQDQDTILAALLHDTVEDTSFSLMQVELLLNPAVKKIVDGVTHLESNLQHLKRIQLSADENLQQLLQVKDDRILYVKLADRLHNMRTIQGHASLSKQQKIAQETVEFFVPMAKRLGLKPIEEELTKLGCAVLNKKK